MKNDCKCLTDGKATLQCVSLVVGSSDRSRVPGCSERNTGVSRTLAFGDKCQRRDRDGEGEDGDGEESLFPILQK